MGLVVITGPASEPVSLAEAKLHCRIDIDDDDVYIASLITSARLLLEHQTRRSFLATTWQLSSPTFPSAIPTRLEDVRYRQVWSLFINTIAIDQSVKIPISPLVSVDWIKYIDTAGVEQTLSPSDYEVDISTQPGRIAPMVGKVWPFTMPRLAPVKIQFVAGGACPEPIKLAIKWLVAYWYEFRMAADTESPKEIPLGVKSIIWQYRADL